MEQEFLENVSWRELITGIYEARPQQAGIAGKPRFYAAPSPGTIVDAEAALNAALPASIRSLLRSSNGAEAYGGYFRLFGVYTAEGLDAIVWNQHDFWKFAWANRCTPFWCFAETAWGDQYAYTMEAVHSAGNEEVYFLDALSMTPEIVAGSFADFLQNEFLRSAKQPYDAMITRARQKLGPLEVSSHLGYVPSILLGGTEDIDNVQRMNARSAMICNGDVALQLDAGPPHGTIKALQPYEDKKQRTRLRVIWR